MTAVVKITVSDNGETIREISASVEIPEVIDRLSIGNPITLAKRVFDEARGKWADSGDPREIFKKAISASTPMPEGFTSIEPVSEYLYNRNAEIPKEKSGAPRRGRQKPVEVAEEKPEEASDVSENADSAE